MSQGLKRATAHARATWKSDPVEETITAIDSLHKKGPIYVLVAGGIATGKTHVVRQYIHEVEVIDVDDFMVKLGHTDYTPRGPQLEAAMNLTGDYIAEKKQRMESMVAMGTSANLDWAKYRLVEAKLDLYTTVLLHVTTATVEQAHAQNAYRRELGLRAVTDQDMPVIAKTRSASDETVRSLLRDHKHLVDYYVPHLNKGRY